MKATPVYSTWARLPGPTIHSFLPPPIPVPGVVFPMPTPSVAGVEGPNTMKWVMSSTMSTTVEFDGWTFALDGHDVGTGIPHVLIPPNAGIALAILFSKYKIPFSASTVLANGKEIGTSFPLILPPLFCTNPCAMPAMIPSALPYFPFTVWINMTLADILKGFGNIAFEMAMDYFFNVFFGSKTWNPTKMVKDAAKEAAKKAARWAEAKAAEEAAKEAAEAGAKELAKVLQHQAETKAADAAASEAAKAAAKKYAQNYGKAATKAAAEGKDPTGAKAPVANSPVPRPWAAK